MNDPSRRKFISKLAAATGATAGLSAMSLPMLAGTAAVDPRVYKDADVWFKKVKGSHRIVYDAPQPHDGFSFIWSWSFYNTNNQTGTQDNDMTAVVVLRHNAIPFAMEDKVWKKYKLGEAFKITDNTTGAAAERNPYYIPKKGDYPMPGIDGLKALQERGVMVCVCNLALTVDSAMVAQSMGLDPEVATKEWKEAVLPGIQVVPSGVWALGRAQENGCGYIFAG
ncbi:Tat (twin-arginine translocation) pathway signal sequence containing protein [Catalinimonas niigatensis]|uniref:Tat (twin-arginine translocation) pathway signal sequence containing protein n=1 Tax=Catalinimonas niigatensis TaxID=1397264 RepID=UPI0026654D2D|nr:Tat (twin-arginine translocation) pathway signal sequence containing protein [Catalinimonas niigatensis]WPP48263.1 Tat (twin-arginine translocation) pathway signal sequence containing protein [Catalinimonas niigatensis]